jgi:type IV pilus assembly protein PilB
MIEPRDLERARAESERSGISLGAALLKLGVVDEMVLTRFLAQQYDVPAVNLRTRTFNSNVARLISREVALRLCAIPVERFGSVVVVAMSDPSKHEAILELASLIGADLEVVLSLEPAIRSAIEQNWPQETA